MISVDGFVSLVLLHGICVHNYTDCFFVACRFVNCLFVQVSIPPDLHLQTHHNTNSDYPSLRLNLQVFPINLPISSPHIRSLMPA